MNDECYELKNIEYKSMILSSHKKTNPFKGNIKTNINQHDLINELLTNETNFQSSNDNKKPWNKLDKMTKQIKLNEYALLLKEKYNLNENEFNKLNKYLKNCLDKKRFSKTKDINYDIDNMTIVDIPSLVIINNSVKTNKVEGTKDKERKFTLKNNEKKNSTLKNLPKRIKKKMKINN